METESIKLDVHVTAWSEASLSGFLSKVIINIERELEEFIKDENDDSITSLGPYQDSYSPLIPLIHLNLPNFIPHDVYQLVHSQLHSDVLSKLISDQIVVKAQSFDLPQEPLFMVVYVKLTKKEYIVVPCNSVPLTTDLDQDSEEESEMTSCAICLENMSGGSEDYYQNPNCFFFYFKSPNCSHHYGIRQWLNRNKSCPLCRQPV